ncbi:transcriptional attenuator, LytR family [Streptococcus henryi]|uniref:Transcriptional attenuator, LytR family n=1 Tax=Streptococcus henryi TaxID=439219 RepID=A0A1G6D9Q1_9STRE|nr:LCP family protein [Streptococcus henryi]SDB41848.1 transcriptional attenuator, LytR family [Streptococcus henryi]
MASRSRSRKQTKTGSGTWRIVNGALLALFTVLSSIAIYQMYRYNFLAFRNLNLIYTALVIVVFLLAILLIVLKKAKILTSLILILFTLVSSLMLYGFTSTVNVTAKLNETASYSETQMSVVVPVDSSISDVSELTSLQAPTDADENNISSLINQIRTDKGLELTTEKTASYQESYENLMANKSQAMVLNSAYSSLLELSYPDYESTLKTIYTYTVTKQVNNEAKPADSNVFNIYISGIDTYGSISTVSRSDVNIIMTVNMNTHKILLTTTPRDSYVQIPNGGANQYDKLTHAGIYGVETSEQTLENLYGIDIDYYARINFTSFLTLIDLLGGVEVYNDQAFTSLHGNFDFPVGNVTLNSEQALGFVRERYSLQGGDNDRGKNQSKVIAAIINKLTSINSLSNLTSIVDGLQTSIQTNMPLEAIMSLANTQMSSGSQFEVTSQAVTGTGSTGQLTSYAMPTASLYMMQLDQSSVSTASHAIKDIMEGK